MIQSKKHKHIKYEWYDFIDVETLDYLSWALMTCSDTYMAWDIVILKYNKQWYDELIRYIHKIIWSPHSETTAHNDE